MLVYDLSSNTIKAYENSAWVSYSSQATSIASVIVNCESSSINGNYSRDSLLTAANTVSIRVENNSFSPATVNAAVGDLTLTGSGALGMTVASVSATSFNPGASGGYVNIIFTLSGTPTTVGSFTATYKNLSLTCAKTSAVCIGVTPLTITNITTPSTLPPTIATGNTIDFTAAGGLNNTDVSWVMSSTPATGMFSSPTTGTGNTAHAVLIAGASGVVTVIFTATNACGYKAIQTQTVSAGALFVNCPASTINGIYTKDSLLKTSNTITMVVTNNALTSNTVNAAPGNIVLTGANAGMTVASVLPTSSNILAGGSTSFVYTLTGTPTTAGAFTATYTNGPLTCEKTGTVCLGITPVTVTNITSPSPLVSPIVAGSSISFTAAGGTNNTGISWVMTSSPATGVFTNPTSTGTGNTAQAVLAAGSAGTVTVVFTATNACGLTVTGTQTAAVGDLQADCEASIVYGIFTQNRVIVTDSNYIRMVIKNNGTTAKDFTPATGNMVLTGTGAAGITVASVSPATTTSIPAGNSINVIYKLSGTPTTVGNFTATFTNVNISCVKTGTVCLDIAPIATSIINSPATLPNPIVAGNTITFNATGGTPNMDSLSWTMTSLPASGVFSNTVTTGKGNNITANLVAGATGNIFVTFTARNACGLIVTKTQTASTGDALRLALVAGGCTSCTAYDAAASDTWVKITASEYQKIDSFMTVNIAASNEALLSQTTSGDASPYTFLAVGPNIKTLPTNNYVVAFSIVNYNNAAVTGAYLKYSTSVSSGFSMGGPSLSIPAGTAGIRIYNIMKRPSTVVNSQSPSYVALYSSTLSIGTISLSGSGRYYGSADASTLTWIEPTGGTVNVYQVKGTSVKRW